MAANIKDVAKTANVSTATVSHVINGTRYVSQEVKDRVHQAMTVLHYRPNLVARSLRSQQSNTIGLVIPDVSNFYYTSVAESTEIILRKNGYHMILSNSHDNVEVEKEMIKVYNSLLLDGLIIVPALGDQSYLNEVLDGTYPVVFADRRPRGIQGDVVILEHIESTYNAISYLLEKGHRNIGLVTGDRTMSTTIDRIIGYGKALNSKGLDINETLVKSGEFTFDAGYRLTKDLVQNCKVSALFFANDTMAIGAISYLKEEKIRIPEDVAIISSNNFKWTQIIDPPLSVVEQPSYELGKKAAEVILARIKQPPEKRTKFKEYRLPTNIVLRGSC